MFELYLRLYKKLLRKSAKLVWLLGFPFGLLCINAKCAKCSGIYFTDTLAGIDLQTPYKVFFDG